MVKFTLSREMPTDRQCDCGEVLSKFKICYPNIFRNNLFIAHISEHQYYCYTCDTVQYEKPLGGPIENPEEYGPLPLIF